MFNFMNKNSKVIPVKNLVKVIYNNGNCPYCNTKNYFAITNDGGSISNCLTCNKTFTLFKYVEQDIDKNIKKENYNDFLSKNLKSNNAFI